MDINRTVKFEPDYYNIEQLNRVVLNEQKEKYEQEINQLQKVHDEQIHKLCSELEKSSLLIHKYKLELDSMRLSVNLKEKQLKIKNKESSIQDLQRKNIELISENNKLKNELTVITTKHQILFNEMQDARQYVLNMIAGLD